MLHVKEINESSSLMLILSRLWGFCSCWREGRQIFARVDMNQTGFCSCWHEADSEVSAHVDTKQTVWFITEQQNK